MRGARRTPPPLEVKMMRYVLDYTFLFSYIPFLHFSFYFHFFLISFIYFFYTLFSSDDICSLTCSLNTSHTTPVMTALIRKAHQTLGIFSFTSSLFFSFHYLFVRRGGKGRWGGEVRGGEGAGGQESGMVREGGKGEERLGQFRMVEFVVLVLMLSLQLSFTT